jgi:hypothetical protein
MEILEDNEAQFALTPLSQLKTVEIITTQTRDLAESTLRNLADFTLILEEIAIATADAVEQPEFHKHFGKLIDGISTLTEGVTNIRKVLKIGFLSNLSILEADLLSILQVLQEYHENHQFNFMRELLKDHLTDNFRQWREIGIPELMQTKNK